MLSLLQSFLLNLVYLAVLVLVSPWILWRRVVQGRYRRGWSQKWLGWLPTDAASRSGQERVTLWFHAVSVGELQVIRPLVELAQRERPDVRIVVTTSTDSGYDLAKSLYAPHLVAFAPLDFSWAVREALDRIQPTLLILAELELWPNWIHATSARGIPIAVVNARLSARSLRGYQKIAWWIRPVAERLGWIGAQSAPYRERFLALGCPPERVVTTGNIKFDGASPERAHPEVQRRRAWLGLSMPGGPNAESVWLCGSTQAPEEVLCLRTYQSLASQFPNLKLILVPRHAERFEEVAKLVASTGLPWQRRSQLNDQPCDPGWRIFLADSVGELRWWWGLADLGFVGGSFGSRGGQNMIEPCAYGVVTCFGPNTRNFSDVVSLLLEADAAVQLRDAEELGPWIASMLQRPSQCQAMSERARQVTTQHRGAVARTWKAISEMLDHPMEETRRRNL